MRQVGIPAVEDRIENYPHQFSREMRQRIVIALALCAEPELIIADESTSALDVSIRAQITALLKRLCRERGTAVMRVTHDVGGSPKPPTGWRSCMLGGWRSSARSRTWCAAPAVPTPKG